MRLSPGKIAVGVLCVASAALVVWFLLATFINGRAAGPDWILAVKSGGLVPGQVRSIEVVEPPIGYSPFSEAEYGRLVRRMKIENPASVRNIMELLARSLPGVPHQNHPATVESVFLRVNCDRGFYWVRLQVLKESKGSILVLEPNTLNAVNPNGASRYHLVEFEEVGSLLGMNGSK